ncbi:MAG: hypothetical protein M5R40_01620 [Anaerolineae bacterium]|nr:hypothetical protein [Anaerolineae bacterium]
MQKKLLTTGLLVVLALSSVLTLGAAQAQEEEPRCDVAVLSVAAAAIGVTEDALRAALADGQTIAEVAEANDVDPDAVVDAIVEHQVSCAGELPASAARRYRNNAEAMALDLVYGDALGGVRLRFGGLDTPEITIPDVWGAIETLPAGRLMWHQPWIEAAAEAIGIEADALLEALGDGQTIAEVAEANGADLDAVIDAIVAAETARITDNARSFVEESLGVSLDIGAGRSLRLELGQGRGMGFRFNIQPFSDRIEARPMVEIAIGGMADWLEVAADAIGVERDALVEALSDGQTIAEVAEANDVNPDAVVDAIVAAETEDLAEEVAAFVEAQHPMMAGIAGRFGSMMGQMGRMMEERLQEGLRRFDFGRGGRWEFGQGRGPRIEIYPDEAFGPFGHGMIFGMMDPADRYEAAADAIGIDVEALLEVLDDGQTIAEVAEANDVDPEAVVDALAADMEAEIDQAVEEGLFSEDVADAMRARAQAWAEQFVMEGAGWMGFHMGPGAGFFEWRFDEESAPPMWRNRQPGEGRRGTMPRHRSY